MVRLRPIERIAAWNIRIVGPSPSDELITGVFQSIQSPFLQWRDLFDDLLLCFDLESAVTSPLGQLTLWNRNKDETFANNKTFVCFSTDESDSNMLSTFIRVGNSTDGSDTSDELAFTLTLTLVLHKISQCSCTKSCLDDHLSSGCATPLKLARNPRIVFLPIPGAASSTSIVPTPHQFDQSPPAKRAHASASVSSQGLASRNSGQSSPTPKLAVPADLDSDVKIAYAGRCAISGFTSSWGKMVSGPGLECAHLFPKSLLEWYDYPNESTRVEKWNCVNSYKNCILMDSFTHRIHDNRLVAIHPVTHRVRLFAPISPLIHRNYSKAYFPALLPWQKSLQWHYDHTVVENMWAGFFLAHADIDMKTQHDFPTNKFLPGTSYRRKRSLSSSSADFDMGDQYDFSTKLAGLLEDEALRQADRERVLQWAKD